MNTEGQAETLFDGREYKAICGFGAKCWSKGLMIFERGEGFYFGSWQSGKYNWLGRYHGSDGSRYEGGWMSGLMHGHGKFTWPPQNLNG